MSNSKTRRLSSLLAFGVFFILTSCASVNRSAQSTEDALQSAPQEERLREMDEQLRSDPGNTDLKLQKANLLYDMAKSTSRPGQRITYYQNIRDLADEILRESGRETALNSLLTNAWTFEQSEGVRLLQQSNNNASGNATPNILSHFDNAITVIPDSLVTYSLKATTLYRQGRMGEAIRTLEAAEAGSSESQPDLKEKLAYLYLENGNPEEAIRHYEQLTSDSPDDYHLLHGLSNAYIINRQHEEAVSILRQLTSEYPSRYEYQEALATELYYLFRVEADDLVSRGGNNSITGQEIDSLLSGLEEISALFDTLETKLPTSEDGILRIATFYKNASQQLSVLSSGLADAADESDKVSDVESDYMQQALPLWEQLAETNPGNMEYMYGLYEVYSALGMTEEAESIERSFNF